jgi:hypothetical protein
MVILAAVFEVAAPVALMKTSVGFVPYIMT